LSGRVRSSKCDAPKLRQGRTDVVNLHIRLHTYLVRAFLTFSLIVVLMSCKLPRALQKCCRYLGSSFLGVISAFMDERSKIVEQHYLGLGQTRVENVGNPSMLEILLCSDNKVGLIVYNWRIPKKRYSKTGEICGFFQNLPLGS